MAGGKLDLRKLTCQQKKGTKSQQETQLPTQQFLGGYSLVFGKIRENSLELRGLAFDHPQCDVGVHLEAI